jgi:hypothetical protein
MSESPDAIGGNVTQETFLAYLDEYTEADQVVKEAAGKRKDLRKRIAGSGVNLEAFDRSRKEADKSGERREMEDREYRRYMRWIGKPVGETTPRYGSPNGSDAPDDAADSPSELRPVSDLQRSRVEEAGYAAGAGGQTRNMNPWTPGTLLAGDWDQAWQRGADARAEAAANEPQPERRGRGRPRGSRNRPKNMH